MRIPALIFSAGLLLVQSGSAQNILIGSAVQWSYLHPVNGVDPATADPDFNTTWFLDSPAYNGQAFTTGRMAPFYYGSIDYVTAQGLAAPGTATGIGTGTNGTTAPPSGQRYSAYFKKTFTVDTATTSATAQILADDGAIIYLDGAEVRRVNMDDAAADTYTLLAFDVGDESALTTVPLGAISAGTHTIAISLHNAGTDSSDLGLFFRLLGEAPPPPVMLRTSLGGTLTDVRQAAATVSSGWVASSAPGGFRLNAPGGTALRTIESQDIDLSATGAVHFSMQIYHYEISSGTNFEPEDEFSAKLILTADDNSISEVNLVNAILDANLDGKLSGEEFNLYLAPVNAIAFLPGHLSAVIPANIKTARLSISGINDTVSEFLSFGGALISDFAPNHDSDKDGVPDAAELFDGTSPSDSASVFSATPDVLELDTTTGNTHLRFNLNNPPGRRYAAEDTADLFNYFQAGTILVPAANTGLNINLGPAPPQRYLFRIRAIP